MSTSAITTLGHGTAPASVLIDLLGKARIATLVDVRRFPGSRRHPHVGQDEMARWLPEAGIAYTWMPALGGRRKAAPDSVNVGLRNFQFRAYADHMASDEFAAAVSELLEVADSSGAAVMCSEAVWWRCHRRLLADYLVLVANRPVEHLFHDGRLAGHPVTPGARRDGHHLVYERVEPTKSSWGCAGVRTPHPDAARPRFRPGCGPD